MIDVCGVCCWGPHGTGQCEIRSLPPSMRGESCAWWDLFRRFGDEGANGNRKSGEVHVINHHGSDVEGKW